MKKEVPVSICQGDEKKRVKATVITDMGPFLIKGSCTKGDLDEVCLQ